MKKLFTLCSIMLLGAVNVFAQDDFVEEDMTHYIVNAGFDEDMTFNADGSTKEITYKGAALSAGRSWPYMAADSSVYMWTDSKSPNWNGSDGRTHAYNGYVGQIKGWEMASRDFSFSTEWTYFGVLPYDLAEKAIPVADDGTGYQPVPAKPDFANGDDNKGALFLRAGWGGQCSYKQVVKLPCAVYRLEYWSININQNTTSTPEDLTNITCRKDVFKDETGSNLTATEWTKHEFEFTPTSEFTVEFGYKSANAGSAGQAYVFIDGIKLVKIGEADKMQLLEADLADLVDSLYNRYDNANITENIVAEMEDAIMEAENYETAEELEANIKTFKEFITKVDEALVEVGKYNILAAKVEEYLDSENPYPGASALNDAYTDISERFETATIKDYATLAEEMQTAINNYLLSQEATMENPADYTFLVKHPNFVTEGNDPVYDADGIATYPNAFDDYNTIATSEGWYKGSNTDGDQRLNNAQGRICWNLWSTSASTANVNDRSINQDLTNLPAGYYSVAADFITQPDWPYEAHAFAKNSHSDVSSPFLTVGNWTDAEPWGAWTTLTTEKILVADGNLTIGGRAIFPEANQKGWFCMTNVKLYYHGPFTAEDYKEIYDKSIAEAQAMCDTMVYAADKAAFAAVIEKYKGATTVEDMNASLDSIGAAKEVATASINKWIGVKTGSWANLKDSIAAGVYSTDGTKVAQKIVDIMTAKIYAEDATYTTMDGLTAVLRKYRDGYLPALANAESKVYTVAAATEVIKATIEAQVADLVAITDMPTEAAMDEFVNHLNAAIIEADRLETLGTIKVEAGTDMTDLIVNPTIEGSATGWTVDKPVGDGPAKNGQQFDGGDGYYIDSWNATAGNLRFTAYQTLTNIPNGRYEIKAMTRTSGDGAYIYGIADNDSATVALKHFTKNGEYNYTQNIDPSVTNQEGNDSIAAATDRFGEIWLESSAWVVSNLGMSLLKDPDTGSGIFELIEEYKINNEGNIDEATMYHLNVTAANNGLGRGWAYSKVEIDVKDHTLILGVTTDSVFTEVYKDVDGNECVPFNGTWFSADNFTLTLITPGDNSDWNPGATGIESIETPEGLGVRVENGAIIANGEIYSISGARVANGTKVPAGVYIVRQGKVAKKVLVK